MTKIKIEKVTKYFTADNGEKKTVISDFSFEINDPSFVTIVGPNGCGKSTLLNLISGIIKPNQGKISIMTNHGKEPNIGYIWQNYRASLLPWLNVGENITFPLRITGVNKRERKKIAINLLSDFKYDISTDLFPYQLSGGQQQLICLIRSFVSKPDFLLLDEPFSALDQANRWSMSFKFEEIWLKEKIPVLFVSHDVDEAVLLSDKILLLSGNGNSKFEWKIVYNNLPRPRNVKMLTSKEHFRCREKVIGHLFEEGAIRDRLTSN